MILDQRTDVEFFYLEALEQVRIEVRERRMSEFSQHMIDVQSTTGHHKKSRANETHVTQETMAEMVDGPVRLNDMD